MPGNAVCSAPPDGSLDFGSALTGATAAFGRLFPSEAAVRGGGLFRPPAGGLNGDGSGSGNGGADADGSGDADGAVPEQDSDDEAVAALEAALRDVDV